MTRLLPMLLLIASLHQNAHATTRESSDSAVSSGAESIMVLVPVLAAGLAGANGSVWDTDLWVTNTTDLPIYYRFGECNLGCCCAEHSFVSPQVSFAERLDEPRGEWFSLPADGSLQFQARFRDRTRAGLSAGVELPIVREEDFVTDELSLPGIPQDARFRTMVRLYAREPGVVLRVEELDFGGGVLRQRDMALSPPGSAYNGPIPAYAQWTLPSDPTGEFPTRLRIRPLTGNSRFWAFASVTNNETSEVTIIQPWR